MQVNACLLAKKPTELEEGEWTSAAAGKLEPNMTRRSSLRAIPATIYGSGFWGRNAKSLLAETDGY